MPTKKPEPSTPRVTDLRIKRGSLGIHRWEVAVTDEEREYLREKLKEFRRRK